MWMLRWPGPMDEMLQWKHSKRWSCCRPTPTISPFLTFCLLVPYWRQQSRYFTQFLMIPQPLWRVSEPAISNGTHQQSEINWPAYPNLTFGPAKSKLKFGKINQTGNSALSEMFIFSLSPQLRFVWQSLGGSQWQKVRRNGIAMVAWLLHTSRSKERQNGIQRRPLLHCCINWMHHRIIYIRCKEASPVLHSNVNLMHYIMWDKVALISKKMAENAKVFKWDRGPI